MKTIRTTNWNSYGDLRDVRTNELLRPATVGEMRASVVAAARDGGCGAIDVNGRSCYVDGGVAVYCETCDEAREPEADIHGCGCHCPTCGNTL